MFFSPRPPPTQEKKENKGCDHEKNEYGNEVPAFLLLFLEFAMICSKQKSTYLVLFTGFDSPYYSLHYL